MEQPGEPGIKARATLACRECWPRAIKAQIPAACKATLAPLGFKVPNPRAQRATLARFGQNVLSTPVERLHTFRYKPRSTRRFLEENRV